MLSLKGHQSRRQLSHSRISEAGRSGSLYSTKKMLFPVPAGFLTLMATSEEPEESDHHVTYRYHFSRDMRRSFTLELHYRIVGIYQFSRANELVDEIFSARSSETIFRGHSTVRPIRYCRQRKMCFTCCITCSSITSTAVLAAVCSAISLCIWNVMPPEVNFEKIHFWCRESKIFHLYELILESCRIYFGLSCLH